jgi:hypothetical protein
MAAMEAIIIPSAREGGSEREGNRRHLMCHNIAANIPTA